MRGTRRLHDATEQALDLAPGFLAALIVVEMHPNSLRPAILRTGRRDPDTVPAIGSLAGSSISDNSMKTSSPIL